jgi:hypothetical protein
VEETRGGGRRDGVRLAGCPGAFYRAAGRSRGGGVVELHYEPFREGIRRWWELMRGECSGHFGSVRGWRPLGCGARERRRSVGFILRKKQAGRGPCGSERRGGAGWAGQEAEAQ